MKLQTQQFCAIFGLRMRLLKQSYPLLVLRLLLPLALAVALIITPKQPDFHVVQRKDTELTLPHCFVIDSENGSYGYGVINRELSNTCKTLGLFPDNENTRRLGSAMAENNGLTSDDLIFYANEDDYLASDTVGTTEFVVGVPSNNWEEVILYYNYTKLDPDMYQLYAKDDLGAKLDGAFSSIPLRLQLQTQKAMLQLEDKDINLTISQIPPGLDYSDNRLPRQFMTTVAVVFLNIIQLLAVIQQMSFDKEKNVVGQLRLLGCIDSMYLFASYLYEMAIWICQIFEFTLITLAIPNYSYFRYIDFETLFMYFFLSGIAVTSLAFMVSSAVKTVKTGLFVGIVYSALQICSLLIFSILTPDHFYDSTFLSTFVSGLIQFIFPFIPQLIIFWQITRFIGVTVGIDEETMEQIVVGNRWKFARNIDYKPSNQCLIMATLDCTFRAQPTILQLMMMLFQALFYFIVAWGFYELLDNNYSLRRNFWQIFQQRKQLSEIKSFAYATLNRKKCTPDEVLSVLEDNDRSDEMAKEHFKECMTGPNNSRNVLQTHSLHKTFGQYQAVRSASMQIARAQCLGLLGQNGCGKTTTINMLIGALRPDKPDSRSLNQGYINGFDIRTQAQIIRQQIGVCPQFSQLFDCLTPVEHVVLAQSLRNVDKRDIDRNTEIILKAVQLWGRKDDRISSFSGGMRRRVSIAMSLVNNNQLIFLDEPTGSLDPQCKRVIWNAIRYVQTARRKFHCNGALTANSQPGVLLTTHDMVEAESLSNNVAIMEKGQILTYGNVFRLMKHYSDACSLVITASNEEQARMEIQQLIDGFGTQAEFIVIGPCLFRIDLRDSEHLQECLEKLDALHDAGDVHSYIIQEATLEQVFLNITSSRNNEIQETDDQEQPRKAQQYRHCMSVFKKLLYQDFQSFTTLLGYLVLPIGLVILCLLVAQLLIPWIISMANVTVENMRQQTKPACTLCKAISQRGALDCTGFDMYQNMRLCTFMDKVNEKTISIPDFSVGGYLTVVPQNQYHVPATLLVLQSQPLDTFQQTITHSFSIFSDSEILDEYKEWAAEIYGDFKGGFPFNLIEREGDGRFVLSADLRVIHDNETDLQECLSQLMLLQRRGGISKEAINVTDDKTLLAVRQLVFEHIPTAILLNSTNETQIYTFLPYDYPRKPYESLGQKIRLDYDWIRQIEEKLNLNAEDYSFIKLDHVQSIANQQIPWVLDLDNPLSGRKSVGFFNDLLARMYNYQAQRRIKFTFKTLPYKFVLFIAQAQDRAKVLVSLFFMLLVFFSIMPVLMYNTVLDKQSRLKTLYRSLAVRPHEYWPVNIAYQFAVAVCVHLIIMLFSKFVFRLQIYTRMDTAVLFLLLLQSVIAQVSMSVFLSLFFKQTATSMLVGYIIVIMVSLIVLVFGGFEEGKIRPWFYFTPMFLFASSFLMIGSGGFSISQLLESEHFYQVIWTIAEGAVLLLVTPLIDWLTEPGALRRLASRFAPKKQLVYAFQSSFNGVREPPLKLVRPIACEMEINAIPDGIKLAAESNHDQALLNDIVDEDVLRERIQLQQGVGASSLLAFNVQKVFNNQLAVRDISLHFEPQEVFGLLGSSGAGKTTFINVLAGLTQESAGGVALDGARVEEQQKRLGICLQDDVFLEALTIRQHLEIFSYVKGFDPARIGALASRLGLQEKLDVRVAALSGGMRRRMNLAIGLM